jgi:hypothetical protein
MQTNTQAVADAIEIMLELTTGGTNLVMLAGQVSNMIAAAQHEGRELTQADWDKLDAGDDLARLQLAQAIAKRQPA